MALSREQCDVYLLHLEILECAGIGTQNMDSSPRIGVKSGIQYTPLDWAIDYKACIPDNRRRADLLHRAHVGLAIPRHEVKALGGLIRAFYHRLQSRRVYTTGAYLLRAKN